MTLIPIKTFEEMNGQERREYLEGLIEDPSARKPDEVG